MRDREQGSQRFRMRTEAARERDVFRHLHPWTHEYRSAALHRNAFPGGRGASEEPMAPAEPCPDTALVAFAQLCALRLRARRCFVTLASSSVEYVLAEASRTASLQYNSVEDVRDTPWLGTCSFLREEGLTCAAIDGWRRARHVREVPVQDGFYYTEGASPHWHIISDMRTEEQLAQRGLIRRSPDPGARFYAAIPLRAATGSVLGSLTIVDDAPRYGISANELAFMEDVADTITQHLDAVVVRSQRQRSERLIQSLGLFNNGKSSLQEWWLKQEDSRNATAGRHIARPTTQQMRAAGHAEFGFHAPSSSSTGAPELSRDEATSSSESDSDSESDDGSLDPVASTSATLQNAVAGEARKQAEGVAAQDFGPATHPPRSPVPKLILEPPVRPRVRRKLASKTPDEANFDLEIASRRAYGRASNLMRQALGADGVVFVNANIAHSKKRKSSTPGAKLASSANSERSSLLSDNETSDGSASNTGTDQHCLVEAFSTRDVSSVHHPDDAYRFDLTESFLAMLIRRYPNGRIFNFDPSGACYSSSGEENIGSNSEGAASAANLRTPKDGRRLGKIMPGAKTIAFFPIWDESQDRWSSGMFVWSTSRLKYFDPAEDITYLAAWSHSILAELSRLQTIASDKAKGSFISSVSHELRSPLHGILAGVEFLEETELNSFQNEMAHTIRIAGKTLLDTVDNILDYAKISSFTRAQTRQRVSEKRTNVDPAEIGVTATVDLALLTEDVVETVVNAHRFQKSRMSDVSVAIDIERRDNWTVELQPGSWTRILNNLVGNALKYTESGLITIRLESVDSTPGTLGMQRVRLSVIDTGIGMTKQFLSKELYTPFKQANSHSAGTGLGLSIVRRICKDSGAALDITSELGIGTRAIVELHALFIADPAAPAPHALNVERFHWIVATPDKFALLDSRSIAPSVMTTAKKWMECATSQGPDCEDDSGSVVYAIAEEDLLTWTSQGSEAWRVMASGRTPSHVLVLGRSMRSVSFESPTQDLPFIPIFVHQPIGPRKLLRAITADQSSTEMGIARPRRQSTFDHYPNPASNHERSPGHLPWDTEAAVPFEQGAPGPLTDQSATSSAVLSMSHPSILNSTTTERSNSIDSAAWPEHIDEEQPRDTVLLVEDNEVNLKLLMTLMRKLKFKFLCAVNGREAVDVYRQNPASILLVLMDISMPIMDGFTATVKIRETERRRRLPHCRIVALTGVTSEEAKHKAFASGIDEFFSKPVGMKEVKELMSKLQDGDDSTSRQITR